VHVKEIRAMLEERGGVAGGTSAGASIFGSFLCRGDVDSNDTLIGSHVHGFGILGNVGVDQHLLARRRQFDFHELYTEAGGAVYENALGLLGIGIDESTAVEITDGVCSVQGRSRVAFYNSGAWTASAQARSRECSPWDEEPFLLCNSGEQFSLRSRRIITAGIGDIQPKSNL
jgi:cyanophycinase